MRRLRFLSALLSLAVLLGGAAIVAMLHPRTPLPPEWNPTKPLDISQPVSPVTRFKLRRALQGGACRAALGTGALFDLLPDVEASEKCHIRNRVRLKSLGSVSISPLETRCDTALRLAMWTRHGLEPAAREVLGSGISRVHHLDSYNCREIRTPEGSGGRMSTHATAEAVDITGVTLTDGRRISLIADWGDGEPGAFLRAARDSSCRWFVTTLGPDYNSFHADHFHLQSRGWGLCR